jgi:hypothetical protein
MVDDEKLAVVRGFLRKELPGCEIEHKRDSEGHTLQIGYEGSNYVVVLSEEFVRANEPSEIGGKLAGYTLIEHLLALPDTPVVVTNTGLKLQYE